MLSTGIRKAGIRARANRKRNRHASLSTIHFATQAQRKQPSVAGFSGKRPSPPKIFGGDRHRPGNMREQSGRKVHRTAPHDRFPSKPATEPGSRCTAPSKSPVNHASQVNVPRPRTHEGRHLRARCNLHRSGIRIPPAKARSRCRIPSSYPRLGKPSREGFPRRIRSRRAFAYRTEAAISSAASTPEVCAQPTVCPRAQ